MTLILIAAYQIGGMQAVGVLAQTVILTCLGLLAVYVIVSELVRETAQRRAKRIYDDLSRTLQEAVVANLEEAARQAGKRT